MTTGQRISAKRKELNLSQEALGEALNVSRQSIYKWESDASLPEIDKLIALSRLFGVSVGWLIGVEEPPSSAQTEEVSPPPPPGELTDTQLKMVEEIVGRYLAAQPKPKKRRRWPYVLASVMVLWMGFKLIGRLDRMENQYNNLQYSINNVRDNMNYQINSITDRVEEVLKSQNHLTADYSTDILAADLARNTITFTARVVPKTYVEGMEVYFLIDSGDGPAEIVGTMGPGREFTAELTCELTNHIVISAVFVNGDTRQTQLLDSYESLYSTSLPYVDLSGLEGTFSHELIGKDGLFHFRADVGWVRRMETETKLGTVEIDSMQVGVFRNFELVAWGEATEQPANYDIDAEHFFRIPALDIKLEQGDLIHTALIYTDQYGRTGVTPCYPISQCSGDEVSWISTDGSIPFEDYSRYDLNPNSQ